MAHVRRTRIPQRAAVRTGGPALVLALACAACSVLGVATAVPTAAAPAVELSPTTGPPGAQVTVTPHLVEQPVAPVPSDSSPPQAAVSSGAAVPSAVLVPPPLPPVAAPARGDTCTALWDGQQIAAENVPCGADAQGRDRSFTVTAPTDLGSHELQVLGVNRKRLVGSAVFTVGPSSSTIPAQPSPQSPVPATALPAPSVSTTPVPPAARPSPVAVTGRPGPRGPLWYVGGLLVLAVVVVAGTSARRARRDRRRPDPRGHDGRWVAQHVSVRAELAAPTASVRALRIPQVSVRVRSQRASVAVDGGGSR